MRYNFNGKNINIPNEEIDKSMKLFGISENDAIQMWLEDEGYLDNEEQAELEQKAKDNRITATIHDAGNKKTRKAAKPKTVKVSDEKQVLFAQILSNLQFDYENVEVLKQNKLIQVKIGEKVFKIDLIEQRQPKKQRKGAEKPLKGKEKN